MENRERDRVSLRTTPTEAGEVNREVEERKGREKHGSDLEFGQKIGQAENLEDSNESPSRNSSGSMGSSGEGSSEGRH